MNELAREIGTMDPDDPKRGNLIKELSDLTQLSASLKFETNKLLGQRMDDPARQIGTLKPVDSAE